ncbi:type II TA system antitoxin MqsA family protein [Arabiibacter massiliensis]|uniref:type II TA system antitoxin MqsA family protein n=1 Tax=Arabiibacter massiliensis TaxID=1870985 RepID=UPI0009B973D5|nr:type II TA system antitoxin MqsA family protein [Arabiibacter massiliensis]
MEPVKRLLCEECWEEVDARYETRRHAEDVRGVTVEVDIDHLICPKCGNSIGWAPLVDEGFDKLYRAYREKVGIMQPEEIVALRKRYGFSQRVFSGILGIGVASLQRYERGYLPTDSHAQLLADARDPRFLRKCLEQGARKLTDEERARALRIVEGCRGSRVEYAVVRMDVLGSIPREETEETGLRRFDPDRVREAIVYLAGHVRDLYRTKLNKALFYLDFAAFRDLGAGVTGLRYAKADFGPVPDQFELLLAALVDGSALSLREQGDGQVLVAGREPDLAAFSLEETSLLDAVVVFANGFASSSALSAYSHEERGWSETELGGVISYEYAADLRWKGAGAC